MQASIADPLHRLKWIVTGVACAALLVRIIFPDVKIDAVSLGLLALALLPWLSPLIKSAELPGGVKIEFQDVQEAVDKVAAAAPATAATSRRPEDSFVAMASQDPSLAMVGLRIEIEKRLRRLAERSQLPSSRPLTQLTHDLERRNVLNHEASAGLRDLIALGNRAAHGVEVSPEAAYSAVEYGPQVLGILEAKLAELPEHA
jgi:hypothetical protein